MANQAPPLAETFQAGVRDYNAARYDIASSEFQDVIHYYPLDDLAGQAQFYLGEIAYKQLNFADAVKAFNAVLESFPGSPKAPAAQFRKGFALLQLNKKEAGYQRTSPADQTPSPNAGSRGSPQQAQLHGRPHYASSGSLSQIFSPGITQFRDKKSPTLCGAFLLRK